MEALIDGSSDAAIKQTPYDLLQALQLDDCRLQWLQPQRPHQNQRKTLPSGISPNFYTPGRWVVKLFVTTEWQSILWNDCLASESFHATQGGLQCELQALQSSRTTCRNEMRGDMQAGCWRGALPGGDYSRINQATPELCCRSAAPWLSKWLSSGPSFTIPTQTGVQKPRIVATNSGELCLLIVGLQEISVRCTSIVPCLSPISKKTSVSNASLQCA